MTAKHRQILRQADDSPGSAPLSNAETQHRRGRLTARERVEILFDAGSFVELGRELGSTDTRSDTGTAGGDGVVTGYGDVNGRRVFAFAKDMTVLRGTMSAMHGRKIARLQALALKSRAPVVGVFDSDGTRADEASAAWPAYGEQFRHAATASGVVPQISLVLGTCIGADALLAAAADFVFMAGDDSVACLGDPDLVQAITGEVVSAQDLGGAAVHASKSSVADGVFENDIVAILQVRRLIDFLPACSRDGQRRWRTFDEAHRSEVSLNSLIPPDPAAAYDVRELVARVVDEGDFLELQSSFAGNIVIGFGRFDGATVGVVANQPTVLAGVLDGAAARKAVRFIRFCDAFGIPVVSLVDAAGFLPGTAEEHGGTIRHGAMLMLAYAQATVPRVTVVLRKAYGAAGILMGARSLGADMVGAWPAASLGMTAAGDASELTVDAALARGDVDAAIVPEETRAFIVRALETLASKAGESPSRKHASCLP
ncbi:Propionyl-CoA carboxylase beta chain [Cupriavidus yeoncheonensis]|uniref:Propionyl-CoA carboxylase beta chain n=1 Tax=Cupriavidus yeoncheonensis TaxID=1462994 RepID=A0A916IZC7_9BURK|nr:carboxyl transferase domain-containing protein [Cupriavidus yeoncheonensis]CAG2157726.1 Propionyl-CoA carboxylase beta chain [Cupriavidus yeoncheonensis]